jgi:hypothetical protein
VKVGGVTLVMATAAACEQAPPVRGVEPSYDTYTGRLIQLSADQDQDGRIDQWTYLDGTRPLRGEKDTDNDGRIDRWEYFGPQSELLMIGTASRNDGIEDTWTWVTLVNGEGRVDLSIARDRHLDRHEYYTGKTLARVELDTNADGRVDRWDRYDNGVLREARFDTSFQAARPDRRLLYDPQGHFAGAEADDDRDGRFERVVPGATLTLPGEPRK